MHHRASHQHRLDLRMFGISADVHSTVRGQACYVRPSSLTIVVSDMFYTPSGLPTLRKFEPGADKLNARARLVADTAEHHARTPQCDWVNGTDVQSS